MAGSSPAMTSGKRVKPGHDGWGRIVPTRRESVLRAGDTTVGSRSVGSGLTHGETRRLRDAIKMRRSSLPPGAPSSPSPVPWDQISHAAKRDGCETRMRRYRPPPDAGLPLPPESRFMGSGLACGQTRRLRDAGEMSPAATCVGNCRARPLGSLQGPRNRFGRQLCQHPNPRLSVTAVVSRCGSPPAMWN
jgi:hypothetical protein